MSLRRLAVERIDLYYLHRIDPLVPLADQLGVIAEAQQAGKIRHLGLSKVTVAQIEDAARIAPIAAVQNRYNINEGDDGALAHCEKHGIAFVPYAPLAAGALTTPTQSIDGTATPAQAAIAYLLDRSPNMLPIPGTSDPAPGCGTWAPAPSRCYTSAGAYRGGLKPFPWPGISCRGHEHGRFYEVEGVGGSQGQRPAPRNPFQHDGDPGRRGVWPCMTPSVVIRLSCRACCTTPIGCRRLAD
jgi:hypothetical protein